MTLLEEIALRQSVFLVALVFAVGAALLYAAVASYRANSWWKTALKALPLLALLIGGYANFAAPILLLGLGSSLIGDIALSRNGERSFLIGLIAFAAAHVFYAIRFFGLAEVTPALLPLAAIAFLALSTEIWLGPFTDALKWQVRAYVLLISLMAMFAFALVDRNLAILGALSFLVSDLLLAVQMFRLQPQSAWQVPMSIALWLLYMAAQLGIFLGAGFAQQVFSI